MKCANKNLFLFSLAAWIFLAATDAASQKMPRLGESPSPVLNHAFATQLGSGIYRVDGRMAYIYRFDTAAPLARHDSTNVLRLRFPVTIGFFDFEITDVINIDLPDHIATLSLVPTLEYDIAMQPNWWLEPFIGAGGGHDFSTNTSSFIYATGMQSFAFFPWDATDVRLGNRLVYSGYTTSAASFVDDFAIFESGVDFRKLLGIRIADYDLDWSLFGVNMIYLLSPHIINLNPDRMVAHAEWEFGVTMGIHQRPRILGIALPRIGLSYRFSSKADAIRLVFGDPFKMDYSHR
jgi:hypothetical protein